MPLHSPLYFPLSLLPLMRDISLYTVDMFLLSLVNKEAVLANSQTEYSQIKMQAKIKGGKKSQRASISRQRSKM